jgi:hypothetical protein
MSLDEGFVARRAEQRIEEIWKLAKSDPLRAEARARAYRRWLGTLQPATADEKAYFEFLAELTDDLLRRLRGGRH